MSPFISSWKFPGKSLVLCRIFTLGEFNEAACQGGVGSLALWDSAELQSWDGNVPGVCWEAEVPTPAVLSSAQLSLQYLPSECTARFWGREGDGFWKSHTNKSHLAGSVLPCSSLLVKSSSKTGSVIQK